MGVLYRLDKPFSVCSCYGIVSAYHTCAQLISIVIIINNYKIQAIHIINQCLATYVHHSNYYHHYTSCFLITESHAIMWICNICFLWPSSIWNPIGLTPHYHSLCLGTVVLFITLLATVYAPHVQLARAVNQLNRKPHMMLIMSGQLHLSILIIRSIGYIHLFIYLFGNYIYTYT